MTGSVEPKSDEPVVRIKLPWPFILTVLGAGIAAVMALQSSVGRLTEQVSELKVAVQQGNAITVTLQRDVDVLRWRTETNEKDITFLKQQPRVSRN